MIKYNALGNSTNGETKLIKLNERQMFNILHIIKCYKEELCSSNQDIQECEELIEKFKNE